MRNLAKKLHQYSLYAFVFTLPWQTIWILREVFYDDEKWQYGTIGIYLSDIFLISFIALSIALYRKNLEHFIYKEKTLISLLIVFSIWIFASISWSDDKTLALYTAIKTSLSIDLFIILCALPIRKILLMIAFIFSVTVHCTIGIWQFLSQSTVAQKYLGMQYHSIWHGMTATLSTESERWLRAYGALPHPNILGGLAVLALLFSVYLCSRQNKNLFILLNIISISILTSGVVLSFSRSAWIGLTVSLLALFLLKILQKKSLKSFIIPLLTIILVIIMWISLCPDLFHSRSSATTHSHNSISDRKSYILHTRELVKKHYIGGVGVGNYTNTAYYTIKNSAPIWQFQPVHNIYLLAIAEIGIIGIILILSIMIKIFYPSPKYLLSGHCIIPGIAIGILLLIGLFDHWPITLHSGTFIGAVLLGMLYKKTP